MLEQEGGRRLVTLPLGSDSPGRAGRKPRRPLPRRPRAMPAAPTSASRWTNSPRGTPTRAQRHVDELRTRRGARRRASFAVCDPGQSWSSLMVTMDSLRPHVMSRLTRRLLPREETAPITDMLRPSKRRESGTDGRARPRGLLTTALTSAIMRARWAVPKPREWWPTDRQTTFDWCSRSPTMRSGAPSAIRDFTLRAVRETADGSRELDRLCPPRHERPRDDVGDDSGSGDRLTVAGPRGSRWSRPGSTGSCCSPTRRVPACARWMAGRAGRPDRGDADCERLRCGQPTRSPSGTDHAALVGFRC